MQVPEVWFGQPDDCRNWPKATTGEFKTLTELGSASGSRVHFKGKCEGLRCGKMAARAP